MSQPKLLPVRWLRLFITILTLLCNLPPAQAVIRDGGIDPANLGKGEWIYSMKDATNRLGGTVVSVNSTTTLFQYYKKIGVRYVMIKVGTGSTNYSGCFNSPHQISTSLVTNAHANGVWVFGYTRSYGSDIPGEAALAGSCFNNGADGFIYDAEAEWETGSSHPWITNGAAQAWSLMSTVRSNWPTKFLGHAPFPIIYSHSSFPYKEFGYWCDAVMPQVYHFSTAGIKGSSSAAINWSDVNWRTWQNSLVGTSTVIDGQTIYWTNSIKPLVLVQDVYGPAGTLPAGTTRCNATTIAYPDKDVTEFIDYAQADPNCITTGGYNGVNFWRADLHGSVQFTNITEGTSGNYSDFVNNIVIDDANASRVGTWTAVKTFSATTGTPSFTGNGSGTDTNSFGTNYYTKAKGAGTSYIQFTPTVKVAGDYNVYQWHPDRAEASAAVPFNISYFGGTASANVNQTTNGGNWSFVGRFPFATGTNGNVRVYDNFPEVSGIAMVDGLKMMFVTPAAAPTAPSGLTATAVSSSQINLSWTDNSTNEAGFVIGQSTTPGGPYTDITTNAPNTSSNSVTGLSAATTYYYVVRAINYIGSSATSAQTSALTFAAGGTAPSILSQPQNKTVIAGSNATFSVTAAGTATLNYQWRLNAGNIAGATASAYTRTNVTAADAGNYSVIVTNAYGTVTSSNAVLTVTVVPPSITTQPQGSTNSAGTTASFIVTATGTSPLAYQWKKNGVILNNGGNVSGATTTNLTLASVALADTADYSVTITNSAGTVTSSNATLVVNSVPVITSNPTNQTYNAGSTAVFTVTATGSQPLAYQWKKNGTNMTSGGNISGATTSSLTLNSISQNDAANYTVLVTNSFGNASSSAAALNVIDPPVITTQPSNRTTNAGSLVSFTVVASGTSPTYKWLKGGVTLSNGGNVSGATTATLNLASVGQSDEAIYSVIVSNSAASVTSSNAALTVLIPPSISTQPQNQTVSVGGNATFSVLASGTSPLSYRWRFNGTTIASATNSSYTKVGVQTNDAGSYSVVITNLAGTVTSSNAVLTANAGQTQVTTVSNLWNITAGSRSYVSIGSTERGVAINTVSNHVLILSRAVNANGSIVAVNADTGADLGISLNTPTNVINGGQFVLNKLGVTSNGIVYAANLTTASGTSPLKIYRWANYSDTPVLAYSGAPDGGTTLRWGDSFALRGSGTGTQIIIGGSASTNVLIFTTTNGTNFTPTIINPPAPVIAGAFSKGLAFGAGNTFYIKNRSATTATNYSFNLGTGGATVNSLISGLDTNMIAVAVDSSRQILTGVIDDATTNTSGHLFKTYDVSNPGSPSLLATFNFPSLGSGTNSGANTPNFAAHVDTDGSKVIGLDTHNGLVAAQVYVQVSPLIVTAPQDQSILEGENAIFTVTASGTATLGYQWKKDGSILSNGVNVSGATTASLTIATVSAADEADYTVTVSNPIGSVDSTAGTLTVLISPSISTQPNSQTVNAGESATFSIVAAGSAPLSYQWFKGAAPLTNNANLFGANSSSLILANVTQADAADYSVTVTNIAGQTTSTAVHLTVIDPPVITTNPVSQTLANGSVANFAGSASGSNLDYQWRKNGIALSNGGNVSGAGTATLTLTGVSQSDVADYSLYVTNTAGTAQSSAAHLAVVDAPNITISPASRTNDVNTTATFTVTANGQSLAYQWKKNGNVLSNGGNVSGATTSTLTIANVTQNDAYDYSVTVTNLGGVQTSDSAHLTVIDPPVITSQPTNSSKNSGETATFTVTASSATSLTYRWKKENINLNDGGHIIGATSSILTLTEVSSSDAGDYTVVVSNSAGSTNSGSAQLIVTETPAILVQPVSQVKGLGTNATVTVSASGTAPLAYQWFKNGTNLSNGGKISGANTTALTILGGDASDIAGYSARVTNSAGSAFSDVATLEFLDLPVITAQPANQTNQTGATIYFEVTTTGENLVYQWQRNNINIFDDATDNPHISGATTAKLTIRSISKTDEGSYTVLITSAGTLVSDPAVLTVLDPWITSQPVPTSVNLSNNTSLAVAASGTPTLSYQWYFKATAALAFTRQAGKTNATLALTNCLATADGNYFAVVSNLYGMRTSDVARVTVITPPKIAAQPTVLPRATVPNGSMVTFGVVGVTGTSPMYQWFLNNVAITGATMAKYTNTSATFADNGTYTVVASNAAGSVTNTNTLMLTVVQDTNVPTVVITKPSALSITTSTTNSAGSVTAYGSATDNARVANVFYRLNGSGWMPVTTFAPAVNGLTAKWTNELTAATGTNTLEVYSVDYSGTNSKIAKTIFFFHVPSVLTVSYDEHNSRADEGFSSTNAAWWPDYRGTAAAALVVAPNTTPTNLASLYVNRGPYKLTAIAGHNQMFTNWTRVDNGVTNLFSTNAVLTFVMETNLHLVANFAHNPWMEAAGEYNGLFANAGTDFESSGFISLLIATNRTFSGKLLIDGDNLPLSGSFNVDGTRNLTISRALKGKTNLFLGLKILFGADINSGTASGTNQIIGVVTNGTVMANLVADQWIYKGASTNPYFGKYTMILPPTGNDAAASPGGYGYGLMTVATNAKPTVIGALADSTVFTPEIAPISLDGRWPVFKQIYAASKLRTVNFTNDQVFHTNVNNLGAYIGWLTFSGNTGFSGDLKWIKTIKEATNLVAAPLGVYTNYYTNGFSSLMTVTASRYSEMSNSLPTGADKRVIQVTNAVISFTNGNLTGLQTQKIRMTTNNVIKFITNFNLVTLTNQLGLKATNSQLGSLSVSFLSASGKMSGSFTNVISVLPTGASKSILWSGAILQPDNVGYGYFLGTNQSGAVYLQQDPGNFNP